MGSANASKWIGGIVTGALFLMLAACQQRQDQQTAQQNGAPGATAPTATPIAPAVTLADVSQRDARSMVGISYPPSANKYPGLAAELQKYSDASRGELQRALQALGDQKPASPYELSLEYTQSADTPQLLAIAADGSIYTGGAHGAPLIARFVWLPQQNQLLTAQALIPDAANWKTISDYASEQLQEALSQRVDDDNPTPEEREELVRNASKMIEEGTKPDPDNFSQFEPVLDPGGKLSALRFVFPPYQVGPYSDGTQTVEVPASVLLPLVAPAYRGLFVGG